MKTTAERSCKASAAPARPSPRSLRRLSGPRAEHAGPRRHHRAEGGHRRHHRRMRPARHAVRRRAHQRRRRHRRAQGRAHRRGGDQPEGFDRAAEKARAAGQGRLRAGHRLLGREPGDGRGRRGDEGAAHLLGRHDAGRRQGDDARTALRLPQHRQRVRGGDGLAARDQALEGQVRDRSPASTPTTRTAATTSPPSRRC